MVFVVWLTKERRLALFPARTIVRDPHHRETPTRREQGLNCTEPEFSLSWMKLCSSDNHYTTAPYVWGLLVWPFMQSAIPTNWYFVPFFVWSVNCSSLICKLWILFWTFRGMWTVLKYYRIFQIVLYTKINCNW